MRGELPGDLDQAIVDYKAKLSAEKPKVATRKSSEMALEVINGVVPETIGGSADLTGSNNTKTSQTKAISAGAYGNRYVHYGIREHGMAAALNGSRCMAASSRTRARFLVLLRLCAAVDAPRLVDGHPHRSL